MIGTPIMKKLRVSLFCSKVRLLWLFYAITLFPIVILFYFTCVIIKNLCGVAVQPGSRYIKANHGDHLMIECLIREGLPTIFSKKFHHSFFKRSQIFLSNKDFLLSQESSFSKDRYLNKEAATGGVL